MVSSINFGSILLLFLVVFAPGFGRFWSLSCVFLTNYHTPVHGSKHLVVMTPPSLTDLSGAAFCKALLSVVSDRLVSVTDSQAVADLVCVCVFSIRHSAIHFLPARIFKDQNLTNLILTTLV